MYNGINWGKTRTYILYETNLVQRQSQNQCLNSQTLKINNDNKKLSTSNTPNIHH